MKNVPNETYIPSDDIAKIKSRLIDQIGSMSDAEVRIAAKSEASLRAFVSGLFRYIAELFGYVVGEVIGFGRDIVKAIGGGWQKGFNAGLR